MRVQVIGTITGVCALALSLVPGAAHSANDATKPVLNTPVTADFVVGSTIGSMVLDSEGQLQSTGEISMRAKWSASDASGICGYSTLEQGAGYQEDWTPWTSAKSLTITRGTDYDDQYGGGSGKLLGYAVRARDCADNITEKFVTYEPVVSQEDGGWYYDNLGIGTPTYKGTWATSRCTCFSGGTTRKTTQAGASVSFQGSGHHVGLVMAKGPDRGKANVYVNGVLKATVNTYSTTKVNRAVVWNGSAGTIKIVNLATAGHPRIDLDAALTD
jgi:hypothetical protein